MQNKQSSFNRFIFTGLFAIACIGIGFMLATGWETPSAVTAQTQIPGPILQNAAQTYLFNEEGDSPFIQVAEKVQPVVVNIQVEKEVAGHSAVPFDMFDWGPFFRRAPDPNKQRRIPHVTSGGSGIIIDKDGLILTNNHVVSDAVDIKVKFFDESEQEAEIIGVDPETDVALIRVKEPIPPEMVAHLGDSDKIRIGEWAIAIGNPFGLEGTLTVGVISARGRSNLNIGGGNGPSYQNFIQTDASINFGNSGGPLVNIHGEVIGINTAINAQGQGIGFAIPINLARNIANQLLSTGEVRRGYLGVFPSDLDDITREALGIDNDLEGVFIQNVEKGTPAEDGGLKGGEIVMEIDGTPVKNMTDFRFKIADYPPDSKVKMKVWQDGKVKNFKFTLGDRTEFLKTARAPVSKTPEWLGIEVAETDGREGQQLGIEGMKGALVIRITADSPAEGLLQPGDVIVEVGGEEIDSVKDFQKMADELKDRKKAIPFWVMRNERRTFIPIRPE